MIHKRTSSLMFDWDGFGAYLFDIDGTLIESKDAVHYFAFCNALTQISGREMDLTGVVAHGNTDMGILRDALHVNGIAESLWRPRREEAKQAVERYVLDRQDQIDSRSLPGVVEVLDHLAAKRAVLGVATGNFEQIGRVKLAHAGLLQYFTTGSYSDQCEYRHEVFQQAMTSVLELGISKDRICVIGDTPADVSAARQNGLQVIAVATGIYSAQELLRGEPDLCCDTLEDLLSSALQIRQGEQRA